MNSPTPDLNDPQSVPGNPNPEPARSYAPPETPQPDVPPGVPSPSPDKEPIQRPPETPPEVPSEPSYHAPTASWMLRLTAAALLCWTGSVGFAAAQTSDSNGSTDQINPCQVEPEDRNEGAERNGAEGRNDAADDRSRVPLEDCEGVLTPPETGDEEIEEPAPDTGTTPVIRPNALPEQPPD